MNSCEYLKTGIKHHVSGQLTQAEFIYSEILNTNPQHSDALHLLGLVAYQSGNNEKAIDLISRAISVNSNVPMYYGNLGNVFKSSGRLKDAIECYQNALNLNPDFVDSIGNMGVALHAQAKLPEAVIYYKRALILKPDYVEAIYNLAIAYRELDEIDKAVECYKRVLVLRSDFYEAYSNLANLLKLQGKIDDAILNYRAAIRLKPNSVDMIMNIANTLKEKGEAEDSCIYYRMAIIHNPDLSDAYIGLGCILQENGEFDEALKLYHQLILRQPNCAEAFCNMGTALKDLGRLDEALEKYLTALKYKPSLAPAYYNLANTYHLQGKMSEASANYLIALSLRPDWADAHNNLGNILQSQGFLHSAEDHFKRALTLDPVSAEAFNNLGNIYKRRAQLDDALSCYRKAISLKPEYFDAHSNLLFTLSAHTDYTSADYITEALVFGEKITRLATPYTCWGCHDIKRESGRVRVGLVSGDLKSHPVGYFLEGILKYINNRKIELYAYSTKIQEDALTAGIKPYFTIWHSIVGVSDREAAKKIHEDQIDILIDLAGHTAYNRLPLFAWKPAPIQASWLGYFASTGVPAIDFVIADAVSVSYDHRKFFTEKIWYLPDTRLCMSQPDKGMPVAALPALFNEYITFGCFQTLSKLNDEVLKTWGRILKLLPKARLRFQNKQMICSETRIDFLRRLDDAGISPERITILGPVNREEYLKSHAEVDFILDTFPYPGGTTTCEALWMGVPTLTIIGDSMISRQGASLLMAADLPEWVANDIEDYVSKAVSISSDIRALSFLRNKLRDHISKSALFDCSKFAFYLENALYGMWDEYHKNSAK